MAREHAARAATQLAGLGKGSVKFLHRAARRGQQSAHLGVALGIGRFATNFDFVQAMLQRFDKRSPRLGLP